MDTVSAFSLGALLGLANGAHCMGMCGAFAVRAAVGGASARSPGRFAAYGAGKISTYAFLGVLAAAFGEALLPSARGFQAAMGFLVALWMAIAAARLLGLLPRLPAAGAGLAAWLGPRVRAAFAYGPFATGAVTGAIPCGVVYMAAAQAAGAGSRIGGILVMLGLGLGTLPPLAVLAFGSGAFLRRAGAGRVRIAAAAILLLVAGYTAWRALGALAPDGGGPPCCH